MWGDPVSNEATATYQFTVQHDNGEILTITSDAVVVDPANANEAFEAAAQIFGASSQFTILSGQRQYTTTVPYTA